MAAVGSAGASTSARPAAEPPVVASLTPRKTEALWRKLVSRPSPCQALEPGSRLPAAPRGVLRGHRLPAARDDACRHALALRRVLHLRSAARRRQDAAAPRRRGAHPGARAELPPARGGPLHDLEQVGREHRARASTRRASRSGSAWPRPASTSRRATRGRSTRRARRSAAGPARPARTSASSCAASTRATGRGRPREPSSSSASASGRPTCRSTRRTSRTGSRTPRSGRTCPPTSATGRRRSTATPAAGPSPARRWTCAATT